MPKLAPDLAGKKFGKLTAVYRIKSEGTIGSGKPALWMCKCDCGNTKIMSSTRLIHGKTDNCGCMDSKCRNKKGQFVKGENVKDISGEKFGKLTVLKLDKIVNRKSYWIVRCECGTIKSVRSDTLKVITSCGCNKKKQDIINLGITNHHELTHHPVYSIWNAMINRCGNPHNKHYNNYGGRGIKVCEEWKDIRIFSKWADETGFEPNKNLSIERKDVNGDYCPENCCWIDRKFQTRNRRNTVMLKIDGVNKPLSEWCEIYNVPYEKVIGRYYRGIQAADDLFYKGNLQMRDLGRE
mgnify:FL=1|jgi:hypothetical protein